MSEPNVVVPWAALRSGLIFADAGPSDEQAITKLKARLAEIQSEADEIKAKVDDDQDGAAEDEQITKLEELAAESEKVSRQIKAREAFSVQGAGRKSAAELQNGKKPAAGSSARIDGKNPWPGGLGEFANAVRLASVRGGELDPRLRNAAPSTYGNEGSGADGGFAVPPDVRSDILAKVFAEESLLALTDRMQSSSNTLTMPIDMTTPWQTTGGILAYWVAEAATKTQSKPALEEVTVKLNTLAALVPVTEELIEDAPAMDSYLRKKVPEKLDFKISDALVRGSGAGQPLGFLNSPALVTVTAEGGQTATTINATNVLKMNARMPTNSRKTSVWLIHPDAEVQLPLMVVGTQPVYMPPGGMADAPYGRLLGRPVIPHQVCATLGALGDIMFVDFQQYLTVTKTGTQRDANGMRTDVSIHLWFDQDMVAYRFTVRIAGQPWWSATTTQRSGSNAQSPFVVLGAR